MSRIGKKVIVIAPKTEVSYTSGVFTVKGPLGTLTKKFKPEIKITIGVEHGNPFQQHALAYLSSAGL